MRDPAIRWWSGYNHALRQCRGARQRRKVCNLPPLEQVYERDMDKAMRTFQQVGFTKEVQEAGVSFFSLQRQKLPLTPIYGQTLASGLYYSRIMEWLEVWPRSQVLLVNTEEYFDSATLNARMRGVTDFLGLKPHKFRALSPKLPARSLNHSAPGDYGPLPEPYYSSIRAFFEPDLKLLKEHFGISFNATAADE
jgi:hypothetical protein